MGKETVKLRSPTLERAHPLPLPRFKTPQNFIAQIIGSKKIPFYHRGIPEK